MKTNLSTLNVFETSSQYYRSTKSGQRKNHKQPLLVKWFKDPGIAIEY